GTASRSVTLVILGTDAMLAAQPATAVQLAQACQQAGFSAAIPASWGDELIASHVLRRVMDAGDAPCVQCSCPVVAHRLLAAGGELAPSLISTVSPPVALARYLRTISRPARA